jgi:hypothetical protein
MWSQIQHIVALLHTDFLKATGPDMLQVHIYIWMQIPAKLQPLARLVQEIGNNW